MMSEDKPEKTSEEEEETQKKIKEHIEEWEKHIRKSERCPECGLPHISRRYYETIHRSSMFPLWEEFTPTLQRESSYPEELLLRQETLEYLHPKGTA